MRRRKLESPKLPSPHSYSMAVYKFRECKSMECNRLLEDLQYKAFVFVSVSSSFSYKVVDYNTNTYSAMSSEYRE